MKLSLLSRLSNKIPSPWKWETQAYSRPFRKGWIILAQGIFEKLHGRDFSKSTLFSAKIVHGWIILFSLIISLFITACSGKYVGQYQGGKKYGKGAMIYSNGDKYIGEWKDGEKHGQGVYYYKDGNKYEGDWKEDEMHGQGVFNYDDGRIFVSHWENGEHCGKGTITYLNGDKYIGGWQDDMRHGQGTYIYSNNSRWAGSEYIGEWKEDRMHGRGAYIFANGDKYTGQWRGGRQHGQGTMFYANGSKYIGEWQDDMRHGRGHIINAKGKKISGVWRNGEIFKHLDYIDDKIISGEHTRVKTGSGGLYLRSIVPGWGQYYSGNSIKGYIFTGSFVLSGGLLAWSFYNKKVKRQEYDNSTSITEFDKKWNNYEKATYTAWGIAGLTALVYSINWIDILFFSNISEEQKQDNSLISIYSSERNLCFNVNFYQNKGPVNDSILCVATGIKF